MATLEFERTKVEGLGPLIEPGVAVLRLEEAAGVLFGEKSHHAGRRVCRKKMGVELLDGEERLHETTARKNPAVRDRGEETAVAIIVGDGLRIKGVDVGVVGVFGIEGQGGGKPVGRIDVPIDLRLRVDAFVDADVVGIGKRGRADRVVSQIERLEDVEFTFDERAGEGEMRGEALDAVGAVIDPAKTRDGIFEKPFPFVTSAAGSDLDDAAGKIAELRGKRIRKNAHGFHCGVRNTKRGLAGERITDGGIVDERVGLIGVATFDADEAVGSAENAREKRKSFLEIVVEANEGFEHGGREDRAAGGSGGCVDTAGIGGDGDGLGMRLREKLEIDDGRSGGGESDFSCGGGEASEGDGEFVVAGENADEGVLAEFVGDGGQFPARGEIFQRDAGVGPKSLDVILIEGEDGAGESGSVGRERRYEEKKKSGEGEESSRAWKSHWDDRTGIGCGGRRGGVTPPLEEDFS